MSASDITTGVVWQDGGCMCLARVLAASGSYITQTATLSITCAVYDLHSATPNAAIATPTVTVATSVYDTLQTGLAWTRDSTGYNFKHTLADTLFTTGNHVYQVEYTFTPTSGEDARAIYRIYATAART